MALIERQTGETRVRLRLVLDGCGEFTGSTGIPFLDHMLHQLSRHSGFDLDVDASGDLEVDYHHTVEDVGICLGLALREALGSATGIERFAHAITPLDEALAMVALDLSGRGFLETEGAFEHGRIRDFDLNLFEEFLRAFIMNGKFTLHIRLLSGKNPHHRIEAAFKGLAKSLRDATRVCPGSTVVPSTKGTL